MTRVAYRHGPPAAIVFDFDGVLVNSETAHGLALTVAGRHLNLEAPDGGPGWYIGLGDAECFQRMATASGRQLAAEDLEFLKARKGEYFAEQCRAGGVAVFPGSVALVHAAAEIAPVAVCSGSYRADILPILDTLGLSALLGTLVTADDVPRTKPDPLPYLLTAKRLGVSPGGCAAIEDSPAGIAAAIAAGYRHVHAVCHTFDADRLSEAHHIHRCTAELSAAALWPAQPDYVPPRQG
jgi:HAD superfamily hydrolase (TIGR01509 family)